MRAGQLEAAILDPKMMRRTGFLQGSAHFVTGHTGRVLFSPPALSLSNFCPAHILPLYCIDFEKKKKTIFSNEGWTPKKYRRFHFRDRRVPLS